MAMHGTTHVKCEGESPVATHSVVGMLQCLREFVQFYLVVDNFLGCDWPWLAEMARSTFEDFKVLGVCVCKLMIRPGFSPCKLFLRADKIGSGSYGVVFKVIRKVDRMVYAMKEIDLQGMSRKVPNQSGSHAHQLDPIHSLRHRSKKNASGKLESFPPSIRTTLSSTTTRF